MCFLFGDRRFDNVVVHIEFDSPLAYCTDGDAGGEDLTCDIVLVLFDYGIGILIRLKNDLDTIGNFKACCLS